MRQGERSAPAKPAYSGKLISVEGLDGAGKSTAVRELQKKFPQAVVMREPGGTQLSELMREALKGRPLSPGAVDICPAARELLQDARESAGSEELRDWIGLLLRGESHPTGQLECELTPEDELRLFNVARAQVVWEKMLPLLREGRTVIADRFTDSTVAYQGHGRGLDAEEVELDCLIAASGVRPDLTLLLEVSPATRARRLGGRGPEDRIEASGDPFFEAVARGFSELAAAHPERVRVIDAEGSPEEVAAQCEAQIERFRERASAESDAA